MTMTQAKVFEIIMELFILGQRIPNELPKALYTWNNIDPKTWAQIREGLYIIDETLTKLAYMHDHPQGKRKVFTYEPQSRFERDRRYGGGVIDKDPNKS